ncbi:MAG: PilZ domain-containing protein [Lachnospiraceae bacterium]|nr:PilZ domain-containing protein [Lachnospiraceae bacterium]
MTINHMAEGSPVTITIHIKGETITVDTKVVQNFQEPYKDSYCISVEPVERDGQVVSLGRRRITVSIKNALDSREYNYTISYHGLSKDRTKLLLFSSEDVAPVNHRLNYRVPCSYTVVVQIGKNKKAIEGVIHDISFSGIGMVFVADDYETLEVGDDVSASIFDHYEHVYKITGKVVRFIEGFAANRTLVGVQFDETTVPITGMVASLQRQELRLRKKVEEKKGKTIIQDKSMTDDDK